jgi:hypothetical protein
MQKTLLASLLVFSAAGTVTAQAIPNAGFETWVDQMFFEEPENWATFNAAVVLFEDLDAPVTQSTDAHSGTYAARVTNRVGDFDDDGDNDTLAGVMFTGHINIITETIVAGWPFTARPDSLVGWTKYATPGNDNYRIGVTLTKWNPVTHETDEIGTGIYTGGAAAAYGRFHVAIDYVSTETPDTALIMVTSSADEDAVVAGSDLFVDDLAFVTNNTAGLETLKNADFAVYPNPANNQLEVRNNTANQLTLSDISGKQVATFDVRNQLQVVLPTAAYENGVYLLRSDLGTTLQLVIQH